MRLSMLMSIPIILAAASLGTLDALRLPISPSRWSHRRVFAAVAAYIASA